LIISFCLNVQNEEVPSAAESIFMVGSVRQQFLQ